jgi:hypothetical protein
MSGFAVTGAGKLIGPDGQRNRYRSIPFCDLAVLSAVG